MIGFLEVAPAELTEVPTVAKPLTAIELRSMLLILGDDAFGLDSIYATELTMATKKMERILDDVRMRISRARRGLSPNTPVE